MVLLSWVWIYRKVISPWTRPTCRFLPTCSEYAMDAINEHGPFKGLSMTVKRLGRCHPWGGSGFDPASKL
jgi:putative membrane protein insertion efficiency factor